MTADTGKDVEKEEHSFIVGGIASLYNHLEISLAVPQKIQITPLKWGSELIKEFSTEEYWRAEKHLKKCLTSLIIREMQIKRTLRFHLTPVRMAKIKNSGDSRCWRGYGERGTLLHCWWDCKVVQPLCNSVWQFLRKFDNSITWGFSYTTLGHIPKRCPTIPQGHVFHHVHSKLETSQISLDQKMGTENVVHLHNGILFSY